MYPLLRRALFSLEAEQAHDLTLRLVRLAGGLAPTRWLLRSLLTAPEKPVQAFGLTFANPVGLAAGYDKDGLGWRGLATLGFGHIEVGTVTLQPQAGNPPPRIFRLVEQQALINRLGFPGKGAAFVAKQLSDPRPPGLVLGVNIGKSKDTPLAEAANDYLQLLKIFAPLADYLAINVSSPNTLGLRQLQAKRALQELLSALSEARRDLLPDQRKPLLVKLAPDLNDTELDDALQAILDGGMDGIIATNTTTGREMVADHPLAVEAGGLSGLPLRALSTRMVQKIVERMAGKLPVIGVGGVSDAQSAREKLDAGACLVQVYTGLVYRGPGLVKEIIQEL
jgi:dihydroorotate dehydrogenase